MLTCLRWGQGMHTRRILGTPWVPWSGDTAAAADDAQGVLIGEREALTLADLGHKLLTP